jgi:hypothetical protein
VAAWWTRRDDAVLVVGAYAHGIRAVDEIRNDPRLPFTVSLANAGGGGRADGGDDDDDDDGGGKAEAARGARREGKEEDGGVSSSVLERRLKQLLDAIHEREYQLELAEAAPVK